MQGWSGWESSVPEPARTSRDSRLTSKRGSSPSRRRGTYGELKPRSFDGWWVAMGRNPGQFGSRPPDRRLKIQSP